MAKRFLVRTTPSPKGRLVYDPRKAQAIIQLVVAEGEWPYMRQQLEALHNSGASALIVEPCAPQTDDQEGMLYFWVVFR